MPASFTLAARKLAQELVLELQARGMTQEEIAKKCGARDQSAISRAKAGKGMQPGHLVALAKLLNRAPDAIAAISDTTAPPADAERLPSTLKAAISRDPKSRVGIAAAKTFVAEGAPDLEEDMWSQFIHAVQQVPSIYVRMAKGDAASKAAPPDGIVTSIDAAHASASADIEKRATPRTKSDKSSAKSRKYGVSPR